MTNNLPPFAFTAPSQGTLQVAEDEISAGLKISYKKLKSSHDKKQIIFVNSQSKVLGTRKISGILDSWTKKDANPVGILFALINPADQGNVIPVFLAGSKMDLFNALVHLYKTEYNISISDARNYATRALEWVLTPESYVTILKSGTNLSQLQLYQKNKVDLLVNLNNTPDPYRSKFIVKTRNGKGMPDTIHSYSLDDLIKMARAIRDNNLEKKTPYSIIGQSKNKEATEADASGTKKQITFLELFDKVVQLAKGGKPVKPADGKKSIKDKRSINVSSVKFVTQDGNVVNITGAKAVAPPSKDTNNFFGAYLGGQGLDVIWSQNQDAYMNVLDFLVANGRGSREEANFLKGQVMLGANAPRRYNVNTGPVYVGPTTQAAAAGPMSSATVQPAQSFVPQGPTFAQAPTFAPAQAPTFAPAQAPTFAPAQAPTFAPAQAPTFAPAPVPMFAPTSSSGTTSPSQTSPRAAAAADLSNL